MSLLGFMDSRGTVTLAREMSSSGGGAGAAVPGAGAPRPGWEFRRAPGCSEEKARMGLGMVVLGIELGLDWVWRSRKVGLE